MTIELAVPDNPLDLPPRTYLEVPIDQVAPDIRQPRKHFDEQALEQLAADIRVRGILQPITVTPAGGDRYIICYGERRWRAARIAGLETIPCLIERPLPPGQSDVTRAFDQLSENLHRKDLDPIELGAFFKRLRDDHQIPVKDIPDLCVENGLQISRSYVSNLIRLTDLPDWAQDLVHAGRLSAAHGRTLLMARDLPEVMEELRQALTEQDEDDPPTVKEIHSMIYSACHRRYEQLPEWIGNHQLIDERRGELGLFTMATPWGSGREVTFVRNPPLLEELLDLIREQERQSALRESGKSPAIDASSGNSGERIPWPPSHEWRRKRALIDSLQEYLPPRIIGPLTPLQRHLLTLWLAHGAPETDDDSPAHCDSAFYYGGSDNDLMAALNICRPSQLLAAVTTSEDLERLQQNHLPQLLAELEIGALVRFAADLGITLDNWRVPRHYVEALSLEEFNAWLSQGGFSTDDCPEDWSRDERIDWLMEHAGAFGLPGELLLIWTEAVGGE